MTFIQKSITIHKKRHCRFVTMTILKNLLTFIAKIKYCVKRICIYLNYLFLPKAKNKTLWFYITPQTVYFKNNYKCFIQMTLCLSPNLDIKNHKLVICKKAISEIHAFLRVIYYFNFWEHVRFILQFLDRALNCFCL